jgi:hypothetical protein
VDAELGVDGAADGEVAAGVGAEVEVGGTGVGGEGGVFAAGAVGDEAEVGGADGAVDATFAHGVAGGVGAASEREEEGEEEGEGCAHWISVAEVGAGGSA